MQFQGYNFDPDDCLRTAAAFQWNRATKSGNQKFILQILSTDAASVNSLRASLLDYFEKLTECRGAVLAQTTSIKADDFPLVLVYRDVGGIPLADKLKDCSPAQAMELWTEAAEALHALHVHELVHGLALPDSFIFSDGVVYLAVHGYAPVIEAGHSATARELRSKYDGMVAPEIGTGASLTPAADIYTWAKAIGNWDPSHQDTNWYRKATQADPEQRYQRMRELLAAIHAESAPAPVEPDTDNAPAPAPSVRCTIEAVCDPPEGGKVRGAGSYDAGRQVVLEAMAASSDWRFEQWIGSVISSDNPLTITLEQDASVIACFKKKGPIRRVFSLKTGVAPAEGAGSIDASNGTVDARRYVNGESVTLKAMTSPLWEFEKWEGDAAGADPTTRLVMDSDKTVVARFKLKPVVQKPPAQKPPLLKPPVQKPPVQEPPTRIPPLLKPPLVKPPAEECKLTITVSPATRAGTIRTAPDSPGTRLYRKGERITLEARPEQLWEFERWAGDAGGVNPFTTLVMDRDKTVVANFKLKPVERVKQAARQTANDEQSRPKQDAVSQIDVAEAITERPPIGWGAFIVLVLGSPWVMLPLIFGVTLALACWTFDIDAPVYQFAIAVCAMITGGIALTRMVFFDDEIE
jgi:hypothetical protein